jgi:hypothetical protein
VFALIVSVVLWLFGAFSAPQRMLKVGKGEPFPSVAAALAEARSGDRIVLVDKEHRESLILDGPALTKIEIRSADGLEVTWTALPLAYPHEPLIRLGNAQGFQVKGIRFDGEGRTQNLVWLTGHCPGLRLENLKLEGFTKSAVVIANCSGTSAEPVTIASLKTSSGGRLTDCAILFDTARDASPNNEFIQLDNCQLLGTFGHGELWFKAERSKTIVVR